MMQTLQVFFLGGTWGTLGGYVTKAWLYSLELTVFQKVEWKVSTWQGSNITMTYWKIPAWPDSGETLPDTRVVSVLLHPFISHANSFFQNLPNLPTLHAAFDWAPNVFYYTAGLHSMLALGYFLPMFFKQTKSFLVPYPDEFISTLLWVTTEVMDESPWC